jgi:hypothetical protein
VEEPQGDDSEFDRLESDLALEPGRLPGRAVLDADGQLVLPGRGLFGESDEPGGLDGVPAERQGELASGRLRVVHGLAVGVGQADADLQVGLSVLFRLDAGDLVADVILVKRVDVVVGPGGAERAVGRLDVLDLQFGEGGERDYQQEQNGAVHHGLHGHNNDNKR